MTRRIALIKDNEVKNVATWDGDMAWENLADDTYILVDVTDISWVGPGILIVGGEFQMPPPAE